MKYATRTMRSGDFIKVQTVECVFDSSCVNLPLPLRRRRQFIKMDPNSRQTLLAGAALGVGWRKELKLYRDEEVSYPRMK